VDGTQHGDLQLAQHRAAPAAHPAHASAAALEGSQRSTGGPRPGPHGISCAPRPGHRLTGTSVRARFYLFIVAFIFILFILFYLL